VENSNINKLKKGFKINPLFGMVCWPRKGWLPGWFAPNFTTLIGLQRVRARMNRHMWSGLATYCVFPLKFQIEKSYIDVQIC
jgi:hypothetical protein